VLGKGGALLGLVAAMLLTVGGVGAAVAIQPDSHPAAPPPAQTRVVTVLDDSPTTTTPPPPPPPVSPATAPVAGSGTATITVIINR